MVAVCEIWARKAQGRAHVSQRRRPSNKVQPTGGQVKGYMRDLPAVYFTKPPRNDPCPLSTRSIKPRQSNTQNNQKPPVGYIVTDVKPSNQYPSVNLSTNVKPYDESPLSTEVKRTYGIYVMSQS
jgi:hypothetical protein